MYFWCLQFPPKNERKQVNLRFHSSKVEFIRSFFGRNVGLKKPFRLCLTTFCRNSSNVHNIENCYTLKFKLDSFLIMYITFCEQFLSIIRYSHIKYVQQTMLLSSNKQNASLMGLLFSFKKNPPYKNVIICINYVKFHIYFLKKHILRKLSCQLQGQNVQNQGDISAFFAKGQR